MASICKRSDLRLRSGKRVGNCRTHTTNAANGLVFWTIRRGYYIDQVEKGILKGKLLDQASALRRVSIGAISYSWSIFSLRVRLKEYSEPLFSAIVKTVSCYVWPRSNAEAIGWGRS